jgi:MFS transporter, MCT family, solute carrier family 16 (monocarboxylic acid transporters), member 14
MVFSISGIGFCFIYMSSVITVGLYFEKWRPLATGISLCGSGIGTFVFAPLTTYLVDEYTWRGALLAQAAIVCLCALFGLVFRPIKPTPVTLDATEMAEKEGLMENGGGGGGRLPIIFSKPLPEGRYAYSVPNSAHNTWIGVNNNTQYPTAAEVFRGSGADLTRRPSAATTPTSEQPPIGKSAMLHKLEHLLKAQKRMSGPINPEDLPSVQATIGPIHIPHELNTVGEAEEENENGTLLNKDEQPSAVSLQGRRHTVSGKRPEGAGSRRSSYRGGEGRPLYRDDVFYSGSLAKIPQYQSQSSIAYHMSVTHLPTKKDVEEEIEGTGCTFCPEAVRRTLATMLDMSLLRSPTFIVLALSGFFTMMGFFVPFMYSVPRAEEAGMEKEYTSFLISAIGISNTVARILCGMLGTMESVNTLQLNNVAIIFGGLATIFSGVYITAGAQFTYATVFGIAIG